MEIKYSKLPIENITNASLIAYGYLNSVQYICELLAIKMVGAGNISVTFVIHLIQRIDEEH